MKEGVAFFYRPDIFHGDIQTVPEHSRHYWYMMIKTNAKISAAMANIS